MSEANGAERQPGSRPGRLWILAALILAAGALLVAIVGMATREPSEEFSKISGVNDSQRIFGGVRQLGDRLGFGDAPVQIQYFTDVQSVPGGENFVAVVPPLVDSEIRNGTVQMLFRTPSLSRNPPQLSFYGVEAAELQDAGWNYAYLMVRNLDLAEETGAVNEEFLADIAEGIERLEEPVWRQNFAQGLDLESAMTRGLEEDDKVSIDHGLRAEPAMIVAGPSGTEVLQDSPDLARVRAAIARVR